MAKRRGLSKHLRAIESVLAQLGFTVTSITFGRHARITTDPKHVFICSITPSDSRALANFTAYARRVAAQVRPKGP